MPQGDPDDLVGETVRRWFAGNARPLPWREPEASPWAILVSEVMLQQTPVSRVLPVWTQWLARWPTPAECARSPAGDVLRLWGRLGYPRRALRLHAAATTIVEQHAGEVPSSLAELLALPGVGAYTARAVAGFAFGQRQPIVDINVARVLARVIDGVAQPRPAVTGRDLAAVAALLPLDPGLAVQSCAALMELGATICTARTPTCADCPLRTQCAWLLAGSPDYAGPPRRGQPWHGTDRHMRGQLIAALRAADGPVNSSVLEAVSANAVQRNRALASLVEDGLVIASPGGGYAFPGEVQSTSR